RIELHGKAADVTRQVRRALVAGHGREAYEDRGLLPGALKEVSLGNVSQRRIVLEISTRPEAAGMYHPLGDALMVEVEELLAEVKIFERRGAACTDPERILVVGDGDPLLSGQDGRVSACTLVYFSSRTGHHTLIMVLRRIALVGSVLGRATGCRFLWHALLLSHTSTAIRVRTIPSRLSSWRKRQETVYTYSGRAQSMPGRRWRCPEAYPGRHHTLTPC